MSSNPLTSLDIENQSADLAETTMSRLAQRLRADILAGRLAFGARLKLKDLSEQYSVSQMPVRDALVKLASEGLLELLPNRGASVRQIDRQFIENMYDIRMVLEGLAARRCAQRASDDEIASLRPLAASHLRAVQVQDEHAIRDHNTRLHRQITFLSRNSDAERILNQGWELIHALRHQSGYAEGRLMVVAAEHDEIVSAIERRDGNAAEELARIHVAGAREDLLARILL